MIPLVITAVRRALVGFLEPPSVGGIWRSVTLGGKGRAENTWLDQCV